MSDPMMPDFLKLALYMLIVFYSNVVQALTGFAGVMLSIPPLILLYGPDTAKGVINILSWLICLLIAWQNRQYTQWKQVRHIVLYMLAGMMLGIFLYRHIDASFLVPFTADHRLRRFEKSFSETAGQAAARMDLHPGPLRRRYYPWNVRIRRGPPRYLSGRQI